MQEKKLSDIKPKISIPIPDDKENKDSGPISARTDIAAMAESLNTMLEKDDNEDNQDHIFDDLLNQCMEQENRRMSIKRSFSLRENNETEQQTGIFEMIQGLNNHRELGGKSTKIENYSTSTGNREDSPESESEDDEFNFDEDENDDPVLEKDKTGHATADIAEYVYEEWYDRIDDLEIDFDDDPNYKQAMLESRSLKIIKDTHKKLRKMRLKFQEDQKEKFIKQKKNLLRVFKKRMLVAKSYSETDDFMKMLDKVAFNFGVVMFGGFAYIMGRWPNRGFYIFYSILVPSMITIRFINYVQRRWHYFCLDFCYYASMLTVFFVMFGCKNDYIYRTAFMYSNGALAVATAAFSNKLIFHKFDQLVSVAIHAVPLICMWNVKQITMEQEKALPESERRFVQHPVNETYGEAFFMNFVVPFAFYAFWASFYFIFNFIIKAKKIRDKEYLTLYTYFSGMKFQGKLMRKFGKKWAPILFMVYHLTFVTCTHILAVLSFYSETIHTCSTLIWLNVCIWNGAQYYVRYFKYHQNKSQQEQPTQQSTQPQLQKQSSTVKEQPEQQTTVSNQSQVTSTPKASMSPSISETKKDK